MNCTHRCGWSYWCFSKKKKICEITPLKERVEYCVGIMDKERMLQRKTDRIYLNLFEPVKDRLYNIVHGACPREVEA